MYRLTFVFVVWMASTAHAVDERNCDSSTPLVMDAACLDEPAHLAGADDTDQRVHNAYERVWVYAGEDRRALLEKAQLAWAQYRLANCAAYGRWGEECLAYMADERAAELRNNAFPDDEDPGCGHGD
jgi:uncharacterized protein YecT (DUF1311 family)